MKGNGDESKKMKERSDSFENDSELLFERCIFY